MCLHSQQLLFARLQRSAGAAVTGLGCTLALCLTLLVLAQLCADTAQTLHFQQD